MPARAWVIAAAAALIMNGCTAPGPRPAPAQGEWPRAAPPRSHYERVYNADASNRQLQTEAEYYTWIIRFYEGRPMFPTGWQDTEERLLQGVDEDRYPIVKAKLSYLGHLVSGEWAKHNRTRRIHSDMLMIWGEVLRDMPPGVQRELAIDAITEDVLGLLSGRLDPRRIAPQRYRELLTGGVTAPAGSDASAHDASRLRGR